MEKSKLEKLKIRSVEWRKYTAVSRAYPPSYSFDLRRNHGGIKPPELCIEIIHAYGSNTKKILDPFAGVGSTLIASSILNKAAVGIEINPRWSELYEQVCTENYVKSQEFIVGDSREILKTFSDETFDFTVTDIPYFSMDKLKKTRGKFSRAGESSQAKLPSSLHTFNQGFPPPSYQSWIQLLKDVFYEVHRLLQPSSFVLIFIGNMYRNVQSNGTQSKKIGKYFMLSAEVAHLLTQLGFQFLAELIWIDPAKKLGIYGYPFVWIPSLIDQRILVFNRP